VRFHLFSGLSFPGLHVWRESGGGTNLEINRHPTGAAVDGWWEFEVDLDSSNSSPMKFIVFEWANNGGTPGKFEDAVFIRALPRVAGNAFPADVYLFERSSTIYLTDPRTVSAPTVRIHLVTASKYRDGGIYIWRHSEQGESIGNPTEKANGVFWDLPLAGERQRYFNFKFHNGGKSLWEPDAANRTWAASAGSEIWVKSESAEILKSQPKREVVRIHYSQGAGLGEPKMWLWQDNSGFEKAVSGQAQAAGGFLFEEQIYTGMKYGARFFTREAGGDEWEHRDVRRIFTTNGETDLWALEGESAVLDAAPTLDQEITIRVPQRTPDGRFDGNLFAHVWVDRARRPLRERIPINASEVTFKTYRGITTSVKFHTDTNWEEVDRHAVYADEAARGQPLYGVLDRFQLLREAPAILLYQNPPFEIRRPGVYEENGFLNFVLHAPRAARVRVWGVWMGAGAKGIDLRSTMDRTFWWAQISVADVKAGLAGGDYHGAEYSYIIDNDRHSQDPAAGWVVHSGMEVNSRLVRSSKFVWTTDSWRRPTWDYLTVFQIHPLRFSGRGDAGLKPLQRARWEIESSAGYFRELGPTAVLIMPTHEFKGDYSWGYDPAFFYAVESSYGGPDALKELVDVCHRNGFAVILDLVLNHSGDDNPLWELGRETFFDGDTKWGALVNFDHPQCRFFFEKCVKYLVEEYRLDGIRLDHTRTILHGDWQDGDIVKQAGSGGGGDFLRALHWGATNGNDGCLVMGEHLPNEWNVSNDGGPLDTQWNDNFHDRIEDAFRPFGDLGKLAEAYKITHTEAKEWFHATNYAESHDEVGNEDDRIAHVAGFGRGLRAAKVHAAAVLMSRGIPMWFMGAESAEWRQFKISENDPLPIAEYLADDERARVRLWWKRLCELRRADPSLRGPAPIDVKFAQDRILAFTRGLNGDYFVLLNFGSWAGQRWLWELNLPEGEYRELWNSTWDEFRNASQSESLQHNGGRDARLRREYTLNIPNTAAIILQRV
jgi:1,4-alpha-glucan branching enzyme